MSLKALCMVVCTLTLGCSGGEAPAMNPAEPPVQKAVPAVEAQEAAPALKAMAAEARAPIAGEKAVQPSLGDPEAQCRAGGAQACRSLCEAEAAICVKDSPNYDKDTCKEASKNVPVCPTGPDGIKLGRLCTLPPSALSPAQASVGMLAVTCKSRSLEEKEADAKWKLRRYLMARPVPVVLGPGDQAGGRRFLTDRHHLSTALFFSSIEEDDKNLYICPMANRIDDPPETFWAYMVNNNFTWLHDREGRDISPTQLPPGFSEIGDDPFRTLSRWVRDSCGYIKCGTVCGDDGQDTSELARCQSNPVAPYFLEFRWGDYMRSHRGKCEITDDIYQMSTTQQAEELPEKLTCLMNLARQDAALDLGLPGWNNGLIETQEVVLDANGCEQ